MGAITSMSVTANSVDDEDLIWQERKEQFEELFQMFRDWHITDVEYAIKKYIAKHGLLVDRILAGQQKQDIYLNKTLKWKDYFELVQDVDAHHVKNEERAERLAWHPAAAGYPMYRDRDSEEELAAWREDMHLPPLENHEIPEYTDDEASEVDEEEYGEGATPRSRAEYSRSTSHQGSRPGSGRLGEGAGAGDGGDPNRLQGGMADAPAPPGGEGYEEKADDAPAAAALGDDEESGAGMTTLEEGGGSYILASPAKPAAGLEEGEEKSDSSGRSGSGSGSARSGSYSSYSSGYGSRPGSAGSADSADYNARPRDRPLPMRWDPALISPVFFGAALRAVEPEEAAELGETTPVFDMEYAIDKAQVAREVAAATEKLAAMEPKEREALPEGETPRPQLPPLFAFITLKDVEADEEKEKEQRDRLERRALDRKAAERDGELAGARETFRNHRAARQGKLDKMEREQARLRLEREKKLAAARETLEGAQLQAYERQWRADEANLRAAEGAEYGALKRKYDLKNGDERQKIKDMEVAIAKAELDEAGNSPTAAALEASSQEECDTCSKEVDRCRRETEECQRKLVDTKRELRAMEREKKGNRAARARIRSMQIQLEGQLEAAERALEGALAASEAAALLLERARRLRAQEEAALPLFDPLAAPDPDLGAPALRLFDALAAFVVVCEDSLGEKLRLLSEVFDFDRDGFLDKPEFFNLLQSVATVIEAFELIPNVTAYDDEVESVVLRAFYTMGGDDQRGLTRYEAKQWAAAVVSRKRALCELFGADWAFGEMSVYQRQRMGEVHQAELGIVTAVDLKYAVARAKYTFRRVLLPDNKLAVHDRAMAMGVDDPLKADYSRFLPSRRRLYHSNVVPLEHGHLGSLEYYRRTLARRAAVKLQAVFRGNRARRRAEWRAMKQAFLEAKDIALEDVAAKVEEEFRAKERRPATEKLKWDAAVRKRQARLRAAGRVLDRNAVAQVLLEEAVAAAQREVEDRFGLIAKDRGFDKDDLYGAPPPPPEDPEEETPPEYVERRGPRLGERLAQLQKALPGAARRASFALVKVETPRGGRRGSEAAVSEFEALAEARRQAMILGKFPPELYAIGETPAEQALRFVLRAPDPGEAELFDRLRMFDRIMTQVKTEELLLEFPSKRLLLRYAAGFRAAAELAEDLAEHFMIDRNQLVVADALRSVLDSDLELGVMYRAMLAFQDSQDAGVRLTAKRAADEELAWAVGTLKKRRQQPPIGDETEEEKWARLKAKDNEILRKKAEAVKEITGQLAAVAKKAERAEMELAEWNRRQAALAKGELALGSNPVPLEVAPAHRCDWTKRLETALGAAEDTDEAALLKYQEIINTVEDFEALCRRCAQTIVNEMYLPREQQTLKPCDERVVDGRGKEGGRGIDGVRYKYEAHNIRFKLCTDDHGVFNGSDEAAAKGLGGHERVGALQFLKAPQPGLVVPPVCLVDYHGFRVLCVAKLPLLWRRFDDTANFRGEKSELVHGTVDRGKHVANDSKVLAQRLANVAQRLNLARHGVRGTQDVTSRQLAVPVDLRGYRECSSPGARAFYLLNFWRLYPPEHPAASARHLPPAAREQAVLYRRLRPEFVAAYEKPLSSDANNIATYNTSDWLEHLEENERASAKLINETLPAFAEWLATRAIPPARCAANDFANFDLTNNLHQRGINVRHLGLLRTLFWRKLPFGANVQYHHHRVYPQGDLTLEVARGEQVDIGGELYRVSTNPKHEVSATAVTLSERVLQLSANNVEVWAGEVRARGNSAAVRELLLAEMAARALKNLLRHYLRLAARHTRFPSRQLQAFLTCELLNVATGAHPRAEDFWAEQVFHAIAQRFGPRAASELERPGLRRALGNSTVYVVRRLCAMLGVRLNSHAVAHFYERPRAFRFSVVDLEEEAGLRSKHSLLVATYARATVLSLRARRLQEGSYAAGVLADGAQLYLKLHERVGSVLAVNSGALGHAASGAYVAGSVLEKAGPIPHDAINRAVEFVPRLKTRVDVKYLSDADPASSKKPFTVEAWARVGRGAEDTSRCVLQGGCFALQATRENRWQFSIFAGAHEVPHPGPPVAYERWTYLLGTFDGMVSRFYVDGALAATVELQKEARALAEEDERERREALEELARREEEDRGKCKARTEKEANIFFKTKEGQRRVVDAAARLVEQNEMMRRMDKENPPAKLNKREAMNKARQEYLTEAYLAAVRRVGKQYQGRRDEVEDAGRQQREDVRFRVARPLRVGAAAASRRSQEGRAFFQGDVAHVAVYHAYFPPDKVTAHRRRGVLSRTAEADRLYALAARAYQDCLRQSADDRHLVGKYARTVCDYLAFDGFLKQDKQRSRARVAEAIRLFETDKNLDGLAEVLRALPADENVADLGVQAVEGIVGHDPLYFQGSDFFGLEELARVPEKFALTAPGSEGWKLAAAAKVYRLVLRDLALGDIFGDQDLSWAADLKSDRALVNLRNGYSLLLLAKDKENGLLLRKEAGVVKAQTTDGDPRALDLGGSWPEAADLGDADLLILANHRRQARVLNLAGCAGLSDGAVRTAVKWCPQLEALDLDGCRQVGRLTLRAIAERGKGGGRLGLLSLRGCAKLDQEELVDMLAACPRLRALNLGDIPGVLDNVVAAAARRLPQLGLLHLAHCSYASDRGLQELALRGNARALTSLDLAGVHQATDEGICAVAQCLTALTFLNLKGLNKVTTDGLKAVTHNLWKLECLVAEDLYLAEDNALIFDTVGDGRTAAQYGMLTGVTDLNLKDCVKISNLGLRAAMQRAAKIETLNISGCHLIDTNFARAFELERNLNKERPTGSTLKHLDVSFCVQIRDDSMSVLAEACPLLESLDLSGCVQLSDEGMYPLCTGCRNIQKLRIARCRRISDKSMCWFADHLWIEELDISNCVKITDDGIEVLCLEFSGLRELGVANLTKLTGKSVDVMIEGCPKLERLDATGLPHLLSPEQRAKIRKVLPRLEVKGLPPEATVKEDRRDSAKGPAATAPEEKGEGREGSGRKESITGSGSMAQVTGGPTTGQRLRKKPTSSSSGTGAIESNNNSGNNNNNYNNNNSSSH